MQPDNSRTLIDPQPTHIHACGHLAQSVLLLRRMSRLPRYATQASRLHILADTLQKFIAQIEQAS